MADEQTREPSRSTAIPLPSGWSDSSEDVKQQDQGAQDGGGGGWDTSSDEGGGGFARGGLRDFERSSAESTRRALLENDVLLCQVVDSDTENDDDDSPDGMSDTVGRGHAIPRRFVPGDPFANEEADVNAWAKHFTYLSVAPTASWRTSSTSVEDGKGDMGLHGKASGAVDIVPVAGRLVLENNNWRQMGNDSRSATTSSNMGVAFAAARSSRAGLVDRARLEDRSCDRDEIRGDPIVVGHGITISGLEEMSAVAAKPGEGEQASECREESEEVPISHGVYEEYLAYDRRPPSPTNTEHAHVADADNLLWGNTQTQSTRLAEGQQKGSITQDVAKSNVDKTAGDRDSESFTFSPQQLQIREDLLERLFDELWIRVAPDLALAARKVEQARRPACAMNLDG